MRLAAAIAGTAFEVAAAAWVLPRRDDLSSVDSIVLIGVLLFGIVMGLRAVYKNLRARREGRPEPLLW
jgi:hypothetical protein